MFNMTLMVSVHTFGTAQFHIRISLFPTVEYMGRYIVLAQLPSILQYLPYIFIHTKRWAFWKRVPSAQMHIKSSRMAAISLGQTGSSVSMSLKDSRDLV